MGFKLCRGHVDGEFGFAWVVDVTTQTYLNTSIVLWADDLWTYQVTGGGVGGPSIIFHLSDNANMYMDIAAGEAFVEKLTSALDEARATDLRIRQTVLHDLAGNS